jgi:hypothetical protein
MLLRVLIGTDEERDRTQLPKQVLSAPSPNELEERAALGWLAVRAGKRLSEVAAEFRELDEALAHA